MKSLALVAVLLAQVPDAPIVLDQSRLHDVRVVQKGDPAPDRGIWMDEPAAMHTATELQTLRHEVAGRPTHTHLAVAMVLGLVAGVGLGVASAVALSRR